LFKLVRAGQTFRFVWNAWGELSAVVKYGQWVWTATYDGLGRRIQTTHQPLGESMVILQSAYDPEVEFLEIGVTRVEIEPAERDEEDEGEAAEEGEPRFTSFELAWKLYGLDLNEEFGGLQGIGGLRLVLGVDSESESGFNLIRPLTDLQGNILGLLQGKEYDWTTSLDGKSFDYFDPYGPLSDTGMSLEDFTDLNLATALIKAHGWRGKRQDVTGLIWMGSRYYDSLTGRFISPDPYGHDGSLNLYDYAGGNPVVYCDPDGRFASNTNSHY
jgi:RHS repeat-associated protein